ncbi:MAG: sigma-70 family RNA polymerase sigma factor [Sedimentisphaerales bacterium]|nr:sigma-70 family RNA polymerase sigma factor [Sedimentisphaerales bacterium]
MNDTVEQLIDEILVMDCQSGRVKAMEMLVCRWQKRLWQYAYYLTNNAEAAWDITQDAWLGIIKGIGRLNDPAKFRSWAYKIVTNKVNDWIKRRKSEKEISIEQTGVRQQKEKKDLGVKELVQKLEFRKKVVLSLYYFEQLSVSEISLALRIPMGTVKSRLAGAREELKELYQKYLE